MKRRGFTRWQTVALLGGVVVFAALLSPFFGKSRIHEYRHSCDFNLKMIMMGIKQYQQDYDEKFPAVSIGHSGWADMLQPYLSSRRLFRCPYPEDVPGATTDYFYNAQLAGRSEVAVSDKNYISQIISLGDGIIQAGTNANITELPFEWTRDENSPTRRHRGGANYAFADGHVKWLKPAAIEANRPAKAGGGTFMVE